MNSIRSLILIASLTICSFQPLSAEPPTGHYVPAPGNGMHWHNLSIYADYMKYCASAPNSAACLTWMNGTPFAKQVMSECLADPGCIATYLVRTSSSADATLAVRNPVPGGTNALKDNVHTTAGTVDNAPKPSGAVQNADEIGKLGSTVASGTDDAAKGWARGMAGPALKLLGNPVVGAVLILIDSPSQVGAGSELRPASSRWNEHMGCTEIALVEGGILRPGDPGYFSPPDGDPNYDRLKEECDNGKPYELPVRWCPVIPVSDPTNPTMFRQVPTTPVMSVAQCMLQDPQMPALWQESGLDANKQLSPYQMGQIVTATVRTDDRGALAGDIIITCKVAPLSVSFAKITQVSDVPYCAKDSDRDGKMHICRNGANSQVVPLPMNKGDACKGIPLMRTYRIDPIEIFVGSTNYDHFNKYVPVVDPGNGKYTDMTSAEVQEGNRAKYACVAALKQTINDVYANVLGNDQPAAQVWRGCIQN